ncbi:MAG: Glycosyltransferase, partial [Microgenomates group bacterium GW2011_GWA2_37_6]
MEEFEHGIPKNKFNPHALIFGNPEIGENVWIGAFCIIDSLHNSLSIGRGTNIADGAKILTHSTVIRCISERRFGKVESKPTSIGEFCFIGANAVVLMGANIGHHSVVAAGSVIPQNASIPPYSIVAGVPGKVIGSSKKFLKDVPSESVSIVIPAYNEEESVEKVVSQAVTELKKITNDFEVVVVDDGSEDSTGKILDRLAKKNKRIRVIHHKENKGFTGAILSCYKNAKKHLVFLAPADGEFNFPELINFIDAIKGYDVAVGYRIDNTRSILRKFNSKAFHLLCRVLLGISFKEISAVILWRKHVLDSISIESSESSAMIEPELVYKAMQEGYRFVEVPFHFLPRTKGKSKGANPKMIVKTLI